MRNDKNGIANSLAWKFLERVGSQGANFILSIILARLLGPTEYGTVALITVFISIATVFVQGGFNTALIQSKHVKEEDYSSILYFSLCVALLLYGILFICAPLIAGFYSLPILIPIVRVLSLTLIPGAFNSIQVAYVTKKMQFRKLFFSNLGAVLISGVLGIILAYSGFGAWAIVAQQLGTQIVNCIVLMIISEWRPSVVFSIKTVQSLVPFGSKVLASNLLVSVFLNIRSLIIGRWYSAESLAYFNRGKTFAATLMDSVNGSIQSVMLPAYSQMQDNLQMLKEMLRRSVSLGCYIIFPCLLGLAAVANPFILLLLTDKWYPAVVFLKICAIGYMTQPIQIATAQALKAIGRSDLTLKIEMYRKISETICLIVAIPFGVEAIAWSTVVASIIACLISAPINAKYLNYKYIEQLMDIVPSAIMSMLLYLCVTVFLYLINTAYLIELILGIFVGIIAFVALSFVTKNENFQYLLSMLKKVRR